MKNVVRTDRAPGAIGPYSQAVDVGTMVFCSGQIGLVPSSGELIGGGPGEQTRQCLTNLDAVLRSAGLTLSDVVKTTVFLLDMGDFKEVNEAYAAFFPDVPPARSAVAVTALPRGARVEIEAIAWR
ncbi:MAG: RidA family protein [Methanomassiliicoccus sp.]|nr:RidA family protein [Methanomassiliicoccus sp.]